MSTTEPQDKDRKPTIDELAGMQWWNSLSESGRAKALRDAGWKSGEAWTPSAADAWTHHKNATRSMPQS
jgi:hypothetical protein